MEPWPLHDVHDAGALCWRAVDDAGLSLSWHEREDLHGYLLVACWQLSLKYDPERRRVAFSTFATRGLRWAVVSWQRERFGRRTWKFKNRVYERKLPEFIPLDDRLVAAEPALASDLETGRDSSLAGLEAGGARQRARDLELLGLEPPPRAAKRARAARVDG